MRRLFVVLGPVLVLICGALPASATVRTVPSLSYQTIQSAIDASADGDTVLVTPGTYFENIDFKGKGITVTSTLSTDPAAIATATSSTIIDGSSKAPAVTSPGSYTPSVLSYFTIQHGGSAVPGGSESNYGGVYLGGSGPSVIGNIITKNNFGGVLAPDGTAQITGNTITQNTCWGIAGSNLTITGNEISTTQTPALGCTVTNSQGTFTTNSTGILLLPMPPPPPLSLYPAVGGSTVTGNTIENNVQVAIPGAPVEGGAGIVIYGNSQMVENNVIRNNSAPSARGGAIDVVDATESVIYQNVIYGNHAGCGGAAISFDTSGIQSQLIYNITIFYFMTHGLIVADNTIADNVDDADAGCPAAAQVEAGTDGVASPEILFANNIIRGSGAAPAMACEQTNSTLFTQAVFDHNLLYNAGSAFFGASCVDESMNGLLGNIVAAPQFVNSSAGNYALAAGSPGIDAGNNSILEASNVELMTSKLYLSAYDLAGNTRVQDATGKVDGNGKEEDIIDMGAYESTGTQTSKSVVGVFMKPTGYPSEVGYGVISAYVNNNLGLDPFRPPLPSTTCCVMLTDVPAGTLTFFLDGTAVGAPQMVNDAPWTSAGKPFYPMASGLATTAVFFTPGTHVLTATYQPSVGVTTATSMAVVVDIDTEATHLVLSADPLNSTVGTPVTFTVFGSSDYGGYVPTPVTLLDLNTNKVLATINLDPKTGEGSFTTSSLPVGPNVEQASFAGSGIYDASVSNEVGVFSTTPTSLSLSSSLNPAYALTPFTLTAQLTPVPTLSVPEYVYFYAPAASGVLQEIGIGTINASGTATASVSLPAGTYQITAGYDGDEYYEESTSPAITEVVIGTSTSLTVSSGLNPASAFQAIPLSAHISGPPGLAAGSITGTISFLANGMTVGSGTIDANGNATANVSLAAGTYSIVASFAGATSFSPSMSTAITEVVNADNTTTTLTVTPNPGYTPNESETLTATVAAASGKGVPAGTVTFYDSFNNVTTTLQTVPVAANGQAVLTVSTLGAGVHMLTASYASSSTFQGSTSLPVSLTITLRDFSLSTAASITIQAEHHALLPVSLTSIGAFTDSVSLSCSNLPIWATCNFSSGSSVGLAANGSVTANIDIDTDALLNFASNSRGATPKGGSGSALFALLLLPVPLLAMRRRKGRKGLSLLIALVAFAIGAAIVGCSGMQPNHTAPGTYTLTITGKAAQTGQIHSANVSLIVTK